ncbi:MAG: hypothetical protein J6T37_02410 [Bacteroidales bacterium]|jgi:hypothetical protein|nr:hypothetical protein [Bacteroidales bacterium]MBQ3843511.1 hypothetical protein [Bacteroidales bacterium]MBQ3845601.1 hypothetical protein [Bacteroidales bacterium]
MKKIKLLLLALLVVVSGSFLKAQEMTFEQMIPVRVLMPVNNDIKGDALTILYNRLNQAVSLNGLGSSTNESRFLIVTSITVVSKSATPTIPVQYKAELEVSFYFVDNIKKIILSETTITKIGMDDNENKAVAKAIKSIQARDPKLKKLINMGKSRAIEYYQAIEGVESEENASDPDVSWINK